MAAVEVVFLSKLENIQHLPEFVHHCINTITNNSKVSTIESGGGSIEWREDEAQRVRSFIQNLYREGILNGKLSLPRSLPDGARAVIENIFELRRKDISNAVIKENLAKNGEQVVENYDWKLKWIMGSSELASIREPVCQVDFHCLTKDDKEAIVRKTINFEMNLEKIDNLISVLKSMNEELNER
ncbi:uncharacterized protein LOC115890754 [Sitophilus oryzae]|uniref:Uncharacterized protein LOC115890754 n=1 Tax=Sitophilus oryzae TaxID=7048 RepID=A0A6J2YUG3_SITOR|nr:uncharacterized protein LOC115890754 [Sitophilus oryzae]